MLQKVARGKLRMSCGEGAAGLIISVIIDGKRCQNIDVLCDQSSCKKPLALYQRVTFRINSPNPPSKSVRNSASKVSGTAPILTGAVPDTFDFRKKVSGTAPEVSGIAPKVSGIAPILTGAVPDTLGAIPDTYWRCS